MLGNHGYSLPTGDVVASAGTCWEVMTTASPLATRLPAAIHCHIVTRFLRCLCGGHRALQPPANFLPSLLPVKKIGLPALSSPRLPTSARLSTHCDRAMEDAYVRFEPNPLKIQAWPTRLSPQPAAEDTTSPAELYARAVPTTRSHAIARLCSRPGVSPLHVRHQPKALIPTGRPGPTGSQAPATFFAPPQFTLFADLLS